MSKRKSTGASSEAPLKRPRANITKQLQVEKAVFDELFEQFKPTAEFAEKYKLDLPGADVYYKEDFIEPETATAWYEELNSLDTWYRPTLKVYGRDVTQSRLISGELRPC